MSNKANTNKALVLAANAPKTPTQNILDGLKEELKGLKVITETQYKTKSAIEGFSTAISDEMKVENLLKMHASVFGRKGAYENSQAKIASLVGGSLSTPAFKVSSYAPEDIESDIVLRIKVLSVKERKDELEQLIKEGEMFLTEADKMSIYMAKVARAGINVNQLELGEGSQD